MTAEDKKTLKRINDYAEDVLSDIDPQKVPVSEQLEKLRPILETIAAERGISLEDMFILYMDLQTESACANNAKLMEDLKDMDE